MFRSFLPLWLALCLALYLAPGWQAEAAAQLLSPGKLAVDHAELEGLSQCTQCHTLGEKVPDQKCLDCHDGLAARIKADKGYHATFSQNCIECHSDHRGRDYSLVRWDPEEFDHKLAGYDLEGAHGALECGACHTTRSFLGLQQDCLSCHDDRHRGQLGNLCLDCHTFADWQPTKFDHEEADFQLRGMHTQLECIACHGLEANSKEVEGLALVWAAAQAAIPAAAQHTTDELGEEEIHEQEPTASQIYEERVYVDIPFQECGDCHTDQHEGQFSTDCISCHRVEGWKPALFDHEQARFGLRGRHTEVECIQCHPNGLYRPLAFQGCNDCHLDTHQPSLGLDCARCHSVQDWANASDTFEHQTTRFPLEGDHTEVECEQCHRRDISGGSQLGGIAFSECRDCHTDEHQGQFAEDCSSCHSVSGFNPSTFDHERSRFKLRGQHVEIECASCHGQGVFKPLEMACSSCHDDYHRGQFETDCVSCHSVAAWASVDFDHDRSVFRLEGAHAEAQCADCHRLEHTATGEPLRRFKPLAMECQDCHR